MDARVARRGAQARVETSEVFVHRYRLLSRHSLCWIVVGMNARGPGGPGNRRKIVA
jgi:hypothetical protein